MEQPNIVSGQKFKDYSISTDKFEFSVKDRTLVHTITSGIENRNGRIVNPALVDFNNYMKRPVVMRDHLNSVLDQIGNTLWIKLEGDLLIGKTKFISTPVADVIFSIIEQTKNCATSMGYGAIDEPDIISKPNGDYAIKFGRVEMFENSFVAVPANIDCVGNTDFVNLFNEKVMNLDFINSLPPSIITTELQYQFVNKEMKDEVEMLKTSVISQKTMIDELIGKMDSFKGSIKNDSVIKATENDVQLLINKIKQSQKIGQN